MSEKQKVSYAKNTEFFLVSSYSALPTLLTRLVALEKEGTPAVIFCFSLFSYRFLSPLVQVFPWIQVIHIDASELAVVSPRRPWKYWSARRLLSSIYHQWFLPIPSGSIIHFYNLYYALTTSYMIWRLRKSCQIHFADCDITDKITYEPDDKISSYIKWAFLSMIYRIPFHMVSKKGDFTLPFPSQTGKFIKKTVKVRHEMITSFADLRQYKVFQALSYKSDAQVLWLMSPMIDYKMVSTGAYEEVLGKIANVVSLIYPPEKQVVKFHPRTVVHETIWSSDTARVPDYIPVEFLDMPQLKVVLAFLSYSLTAFSSEVKLIGLIDLIPFLSDSVRKSVRGYFSFFTSSSNNFCPSSLDELKQSLLEDVATVHS